MAATIGEILPTAAARHAKRTALVVGDRQLTFQELDALSNRVANGLVALGVKPGDRVSLFGANSWEWVISYYGAAKTGAVINPLSSMLTTDELRYTVADAGARIAVGSYAKGDQLQELKAAGVLDEVILWGSDACEGATPLGDMLNSGGASFTACTRQPSDLAVIAYTSGTTGRPKGAMQSHRSVVAAGVGTALMAAARARARDSRSTKCRR